MYIYKKHKKLISKKRFPKGIKYFSSSEKKAAQKIRKIKFEQVEWPFVQTLFLRF